MLFGIGSKRTRNGEIINFNKKLAQSLTSNHIFLGLLGLKNHKRTDAKEQVQKMEKAGIRSVLFSKEGVLETKALGRDLGMDTDWNACITLKEGRWHVIGETG